MAQYSLTGKFTRFAKRQYLWRLTAVKYNFMSAVAGGDMDAVQKITALFPEAVHWEGGRSRFGTWDGSLPLGAAYYARNCAGGNVGMMNYLIDKGAEVDRRDKYGSTALHRAAEQVDPDVMAALILRGADPELKNEKGYNARDLVVIRCRNIDNARPSYYLGKIDEALQQRLQACTQQTIDACATGTQKAVPVRNRPLKLKKSNITY